MSSCVNLVCPHKKGTLEISNVLITYHAYVNEQISVILTNLV